MSPIRQLKHRTCGNIIVLDFQPMTRTDSGSGQTEIVKTPILRCAKCGPVDSSQLDPPGAVCVIITQK